MRPSACLHVLLATVFCLQGATAQTVLNVGSGGFATIAAAAAAAPDGATILIQPGVHTAFFHIMNKSLILRAAAPGVTIVSGFPASGCEMQRHQHTRFVGIDFQGTGPALFTNFGSTGGTVEFQDCAFAVTVSANNGRAVFRNCTVQSQVTFFASDVHMVSTRCHSVVDGGIPVFLLGGSLQATSCVLDGRGLTQTEALRAAGTAVWLADCTLIGGIGNSAIMGLNGTLRTHRCLVQAGSPNLPAVQGLTATPGPLLGVDLPAGGLAVGATRYVTFRGEPGDAITVFAGLGLGATQAIPGVEQEILGVTPLVTWSMLTADSNGFAIQPLTVPNQPVLRHAYVCFRGAAMSQTPIQLSPLVPFVVQ